MRTLDGAYKTRTRAVATHQGLLSRKGYTVFDDSKSLLFTSEGIDTAVLIINV